MSRIAAHTKEADSQPPLPGKMRGPIKLTMLGAGSGQTPGQFRQQYARRDEYVA